MATLPYTDIAIIFNPKSTGDGSVRAKELQTELHEQVPEIPLRMLPTQRAGHARQLAYDFAMEHKRPLIISSSGDGGYNEVINGALQAQAKGAKPTTTVLAAGNANDHARTMQDKPLVELITDDTTMRLDVLDVRVTRADGTVTSRYAHSYAGIGLTPSVAIELNKHTLNALMEVWIILKTFWNLRPVRIRTAAGERDLDSLICSTIPEMAKVLSFSKHAKPADGLFELTTFEHNRKTKLILRLLKGVIRHLGATKRTAEYSFTVLSAAPLQLDGEILKLPADSQVTIKICPGLLRTVALPQA